ncbi:MAG: putative ABC transporter permease, partial [Lachnospiraceae bacterium]|nr:putative ABC transporter permease [Lachnospiraceae bacterium]
MFYYSTEQWVFFFYLYCLFGWCFESSYVSLKTGRFVNRGFMRGPFLPIYGSGAVMMLVVSAPFESMEAPGRQILIYFA